MCTAHKKGLRYREQWGKIVCFKQRLLEVRSRLSPAPCALECRLFPLIWLLVMLVCLGALQGALLKAAEPPAFLLWSLSLSLTGHSFHPALFPKYVYANIHREASSTAFKTDIHQIWSILLCTCVFFSPHSRTRNSFTRRWREDRDGSGGWGSAGWIVGGMPGAFWVGRLASCSPQVWESRIFSQPWEGRTAVPGHGPERPLLVSALASKL